MPLWITGELLADVNLVWKNCHIFNAAGSEINDLCDQTEAALNERWQQAGLPTSKSGKPRGAPRPMKPKPSAGSPSRPTRQTVDRGGNDPHDAADKPTLKGKGVDEVGARRGRRYGGDSPDGAQNELPSKGPGKRPGTLGQGGPKGPKRMRSLSELPSEPEPARAKKKPRSGGDGARPKLEGPLEAALGVVQGMLRVKAAAPFSRPVLESQVPGYSKMVKKPMDLSTVRDRLQDGEYSSPGQDLGPFPPCRDPSQFSCTFVHHYGTLSILKTI